MRRNRKPLLSAARRPALGGVVSLGVHLAALVIVGLLDWYGGLTLLGSLPVGTNADAITIVARQSSQLPPGWEGRLEVVEMDEAELARAEARDPATAIAQEVLRRRVAAALQAAQQLPREQQVEKLEGLAERLGRVSTEESVDEVAGRLREALGVKPRATEPSAEPVAGEFDIKTAQLHAVERIERAGDETIYQLVLVDAEGRRQDQELGAAEGESLYRTWQIIQKNPLLERLYRGIVMQLLDQALGR